VHEQLEALEELAKADQAYRQVDVELGEIDAQLAELRSNVDKIGELLDRERAQLADAERMRQSQTAEVAAIDEKTARSRKRQEVARNAREMEATTRELDVLKREREDRLKEAERLDQVIGEVKASITRHEADFAELARLRDAEAEAARIRSEELRGRKRAMDGERKAVAGRLRADVLRIYTMVQSKRGTGVAECPNGICRGCNVSIPPQLYNQLVRLDRIYQCPQCLRILLPPRVAAQ
jgi:predicted  nucleic acid-binding Zn-ribbon protein